MNSCEQRKCPYWDSKLKVCIDELDFINSNDGEFCCRYHRDAVRVDKDAIQTLESQLSVANNALNLACEEIVKRLGTCPDDLYSDSESHVINCPERCKPDTKLGECWAEYFINQARSRIEGEKK